MKLAQSKPNGLNYGSGNVTAHVMQEVFFRTAKISLTHIPYRGWALAYTDLISQRIDLYTGSVASLLPQILSGKVRALGVVATERSPVLPDVPTFVESGFKELNQSIWWGLAAPGKTPAATVAKLNEGLLKALADPEVAKKLRASGYNIIASTPEEMAKRYKADYELFGKIIKDAGIKAAQD